MDREARAVRRLAALLAALVPLLAGAEDYAAIHGRAAAAWEAEDFEAFRAAVRDALALRPDYPPMLYNLALAESRLGHADEALALLARLAAMGLSYAADEDAFPQLAGTPRFAGIARELLANSRPAGGGSVAYTLGGERDFLPEGLAVDPASGDVFLGSVRQARILRLDAAGGRAVPFAGGDPERLWGVFGMAVDGGRLWVATSAVPETAGLPEPIRGRAAINGYRLADGALEFHCPWPGEAVFGDVLPEGGAAWVTDSAGGLYRLQADGCRWQTRVPAGVFVSPQGLAPGGEDVLLVADYRGGLFRLEAVGEAPPVRVATPPEVTTYGIDGLYRAGDWFVAVQNGLAPHRVLALKLSPARDRVLESRLLARSLPQFDEPTLGAVHGERFLLVANAAWYRYAQGAGVGAADPVVLSIVLPGAD